MARQLDPLTFPLHGSRLIEASAGTGKTHTIAALYLRLVLGHGGSEGFTRPLTPPEILVVTFTNAATEELRERIRNRLSQAARFFREQSGGDPFLHGLREGYPAGRWPAQAGLLEQAAQWMDEAAIHTIHAWCQRMLRQHAFDSGNLFDLTLETDERELLEDCVRDYWRSRFYPLPAGDLADLSALSGCTTPEELLDKARPWLAWPESSPEDPFAMLEARRLAIEAARQVWDAGLESAVEGLRHARDDKTLNGNKYRSESLERWLGAIVAWVRGGGPLPENAILEKFSARGLRAGTAKNRQTPRHPAYDALDRLDDALSGQAIDAALFRHAAGEIGRRLRLEKGRCARIGFDDLLTRLHDALLLPGNQRLAQVIGEQFPVALIDEFQDTDPLQYAIFRRIYLDRPEAGLFMIGDPKQAIYAFRGADIHTYLRARRDVAGRHYTLGCNYRSSVGMVGAVNRFFGAAAGRAEGPFLFRDQIPFEAVAAQGRREQFVAAGEAVAGIHLWRMPQEAPLGMSGAAGYLGRMAEAAAAAITRLLNLAQEQPPQAGFQETGAAIKALRPADIAILVRDGGEARAMRQALDRRRVRSVYLSDNESVFGSEEAEDLLYLLRACAEPEREDAIKTALATRVLALPLGVLDRLNGSESDREREIVRFGAYRSIWRRQGVLPMLRALLRDFAVPARLLGEAGGERSLTNLLHLAEMLQAASAGLEGEPALLRWLTEQRGRGGSEESILRLESDEALVRVVTVHKAKGLEYPLVFLPFACRFRQVKGGGSAVVRLHDGEGRPMLVAHPSVEQLAAADRERLAEDLRLLYVALTRPLHACWLGMGVIGRSGAGGGGGDLHLSAVGHLLGAGEAIPLKELPEKLAAMKGECPHIVIEPLPEPDSGPLRSPSDTAALEAARAFSAVVPREWWIASYSGILSGGGPLLHPGDPSHAPAHAPASAADDQLLEAEREPAGTSAVADAVRSIHRFPRGPEAGVFLHDLMEWAAGEGFARLAAERGRIGERVAAACARREWGGWAEVVTDWMHRLLHLPLALPRGQGTMTLAGLTAADCQSEMEFLLSARRVDTRELDERIREAILPGAPRQELRQGRINGMLKGFIDLVFRHRGRYYLLDYKSNHLGEEEAAYQPPALQAAMLEHRYDLQVVLYTLAVHRLLKARLPEYDYRRDMGGVVYLFLRGVSGEGEGVYAEKPPQALIAHLDGLFAGGKEADAVPTPL